ncbi:MAG: hypothetical protein ABIO06_02720, partial [Pseudolysinimonas sp.]
MSSAETSLVERGLLEYNADGALVAPQESQPTDDSKVRAGADVSADGPTVKDLRALERAIVTLERRRIALAKRVVAAADLHQHHLEARDDFGSWAGRVRASFVWKLLQHLDATREQASTALESAEKGRTAAPDPGELIRLRKGFHRGLWIWIPIVVVLAAIVISLPFAAQAIVKSADWPEWVRDVSNDVVRSWRAGHWPAWWIVAVAVVVLVVVIVNALLAIYYRGWSAFERRIQVAEQGIFSHAELIRTLRAENQRLTSVHSVAAEWLDTLSTALYVPWSVPGGWLGSGLGNIDESRLPFALHVAQVAGDGAAGGERLKMVAAGELFRAGWRAEAFSDLVDKVGERLGVDGDRFGMDTLDNDLPDASNNSRSRLRSLMSDPKLLEEVAAQRLSVLVDGLHEDSLYSAGTEVQAVDFDPLAEFRGGDRGGLRTFTWMQFLTQMLGTTSDVPTPLSPLSIASHEVQRAFHESVTSYIQAPERIAEDLARTAS